MNSEELHSSKEGSQVNSLQISICSSSCELSKASPDLSGFISFSKETITIKQMFSEFILIEEFLTGRLKLEKNVEMPIHSNRKMTFKQEVYSVKILINIKVQKKAHWT